jgi:hypothetical protein
MNGIIDAYSIKKSLVPFVVPVTTKDTRLSYNSIVRKMTL